VSSRGQPRNHGTRLATRHPTAPLPTRPANYTALLRERTTGIQLTITGDHVHATNAVTGTLTTWTGRTTNSTQIAGASSTESPPRHPDGSDAPAGAAVFTKRGDHITTGCPADYYASLRGFQPVILLGRTEVRLAWPGSAWR
jgi:hypothetical protein